MSVRPFHHQRPLAAAAAAYGLGVWAGVRFAWRPLWALAGLLLCLGAAWALPWIGRKRTAGLMGAFLFVGMLMAGAAAHPVLPTEGKYRIEGVLSADAVQRDNGTAAAYLEKVTLLDETGASIDIGKAYWTYYLDAKAPFLPREGERVAFEGNVYHPRGQMNPYGFDARLFYLQKGVRIGISGAREPAVTGHPGRGFLSWTYQARAFLDGRVRAIFGEDAALPEALLLGERDQIPEETKRSFSRAGIAHLLAVSGLHVALLASAVMLPLERLLDRKKQLAFLAVFLLCYCALLDFSAPVLRASLLLMFDRARRLLRRAPDRLTALAAAFLLILLFRPLDLFSASFQLSFCAVLGIAVVMPPLERKMAGKPLRSLFEALGVTCAATLGAAIPTIQVFHRISLLGVLVNPAAVLLFSALLPLYALTLLAGCVSLPLGQAIAGIANFLSRFVSAAARWLGHLPFASIRIPFLPWYCVLALVIGAALATRYTLWPRKRKAAAALALLSAAFALWPLTRCRDVRYLQLAMGQADSALVLDGGRTAVIDAGEYGGDLADYLLAAGRQADFLILTHLHRDHCLGVRQLLEEEIPIGAVYLPIGAQEQAVDGECLELLRELRAVGVPIQELGAGDGLRLDRVSMTVTWPEKGKVRAGQDANRYSLCALWDLDGVKLLSTGDVTGDYEMYAARDADLLKAAHHGSKSSTGADFLRAVSPDGVIFTGSGNRTAVLPHPDTLRRVEEWGAPSWNTGLSGAVTVTVHDGKAGISPYLSSKEPQ